MKYSGLNEINEIANGKELVKNGTNLVTTAGWSDDGDGTLSVVDGALRLTQVSTSSYLAAFSNDIPTVIGNTYEFSINAIGGTGSIWFSVLEGNRVTVIVPTQRDSGMQTFKFIATSTKAVVKLVQFTLVATDYVDYNNISVKEVPKVQGENLPDYVATRSNYGFKNYIINGAFDVWQRGTSFTSNTNPFTADRFIFGRSGSAGATLSRQLSGHSNFKYCARIQRDSADTSTLNIFFNTSLETINSIGLAGKPATLSFFIRAGADFTGSITADLISGTGTDQNIMLAGVTGQSTVATTTFVPTATWQRVSISGTVPSNATQLFPLVTKSSTGTAGENDYYEITGIQLEEGSVATPFEVVPIADTLARCQRFNERLNAETPFGILGVGIAISTTNIRMILPSKVTRRIRPISLNWSGSLRTIQGATPFTVSAVTIGTATTDDLYVIDLTVTGATVGSMHYIGANSDATAYIEISTEL